MRAGMQEVERDLIDYIKPETQIGGFVFAVVLGLIVLLVVALIRSLVKRISK